MSRFMTTYSEVCLRHNYDLAKLPVLLCDLISNCHTASSRASQLKELTIDRDPNTMFGDYKDRLLEQPENGKDPLLWSIESLNLPRSTTDTIIGKLTRNESGNVNLSDMQAMYSNLQSNSLGTSYRCTHHAAAIIIALANNLETLHMQQIHSWYSPLHLFLKHNNYAAGPVRYLQKLKHLHFAPNLDDVFADERFYARLDIFNMLGYFHRLPCIESLTMDAITDEHHGGDSVPFIAPHMSPSLKSITLTHCSISSASLANLIRLPKQSTLEDFRATLGGRAEDKGGQPSLYPRTIGKALESQKQSLKVLELDMDEYVLFPSWPGDIDRDESTGDGDYWGEQIKRQRETDPYFVQDEKENGGLPVYAFHLPTTKPYGHSLGSLREFERLEDLRIGVDMLLGKSANGRFNDAPFRLVDGLPDSLKKLELVGYRKGRNPCHDQQVEEFLALKGERLPRLTEVLGIEREIKGAETLHDPDGEDRKKIWPFKRWPRQWKEVEPGWWEDDDSDAESESSESSET